MCLFIPLQERRREFEANLQNAGLELETEDKSVRSCPVLLCALSQDIVVLVSLFRY